MNEIPQCHYDREIIQEAAICAVQLPRMIEIIDIVIKQAEKERNEEQAKDGATESLIARLRTLLYSISLRADSLEKAIYNGGYKNEIEIADQASEVM